MEIIVQKVLEKMGKVRRLELATLTLLFTGVSDPVWESQFRRFKPI